MKKIIAVLLVVFAVFTLLGCTKKTTAPQQAQVVTTIIYNQATQSADPETQPAETAGVYTEVPATEIISEVISDTAPLVEPDTVPSATPDESTTLGKTGEMAFTDDPNNKYISAVATKYSLNSETLVALYTVPENDANIVLEFDGSRDSNGRLIRTEKTLVAIYSIDKSLNSKCASKDSAKNEYPYGEMMVMFMTTTKYIMPEFEQEL